MKKKVLGFATIASLFDNRPGRVSDIGELTTWCATYSREKTEHTDKVLTDPRLVAFSVRDAANDREVDLMPDESNQVIRIVNSCLEYARSKAGTIIKPEDFEATIAAEYFAEITNFKLADLKDAGGITMPAWLNWDSTIGDLSTFRIWLSDKTFESEYPEFHITVIPPMADLRIFLGPWQTAVNKVKEKSTADIVEEAQAAKNLKPETYFRLFDVDYYDKTDNRNKYPTTWGLLIYGVAGDNIDAIKDAIIKELLDGTGAAEHELEPLFPDLFKRTEFTVWPRFDRRSIPNMTTISGLYQSMTNIKDDMDFVIQHNNFYAAQHIRENTQVFPSPYKGLTLLAINGENNVQGMKTLIQMYPDYIAAPPTHPDFGRMSEKTMAWVLFLQEMTVQADVVTNTSVLPQGMRRVNRSGKMFVAGTHDNAAYLVAARNNPLYNR